MRKRETITQVNLNRVKKTKRRGSGLSSAKDKARNERNKQQMAAPVTVEISSDTEMAEEEEKEEEAQQEIEDDDEVLEMVKKKYGDCSRISPYIW